MMPVMPGSTLDVGHIESAPNDDWFCLLYLYIAIDLTLYDYL